MIPEISNNAFGWKIKANIPASMEEAKSTTIEGVFLAIMIPVTIGTIISQGVIWNEPFKASEKAAIWDASAASLENPAMLNTISVTIIEGTVV